jgi:hypothetical protein
MDHNEILTGAITTIVTSIIGLIIRSIEKRKLRKENKLIDGL